MFGRSLAIQASIKSWSQSLPGGSGGLLGQARSYAEPSQDRSYQTGASSTVKRSLVQDLKYRFRYGSVIHIYMNNFCFPIKCSVLIFMFNC